MKPVDVNEVLRCQQARAADVGAVEADQGRDYGQAAADQATEDERPIIKALDALEEAVTCAQMVAYGTELSPPSVTAADLEDARKAAREAVSWLERVT